MTEFIQTIKLLLNNIVNLGRFKKNHISRKYKILIYLILNMICFGAIRISQEDTFLTPYIKLASLFLRNQGITSGAKDPWIT